MTRRVALFITALLIGFLAARLAVSVPRGGFPGILFTRRTAMPGAFTGTSSLTTEDLLTGRVGVRGPGVRITVSDALPAPEGRENPNRLLVHAQDPMFLRDELFAAGAEAMAINGERIVTTSAIRCVGPVIRVNHHVVSAPYVFAAVGDPNALKTAVMMRGGVVDMFASLKMRAAVEKARDLAIPAFSVARRLRFARPWKEMSVD